MTKQTAVGPMAVDQLDKLFAPIAHHPRLRRIAGGYQTDVYGSDSHHYVVKLKNQHGGELAAVLAQARIQRRVAEQLAASIGTEHSIPSYYVIAGDGSKDAHVLVIQPYVGHARPLHDIDYAALDAEQRAWLATQLVTIIGRACICYYHHGYMPDLDGLPVTGDAERRRFNAPHLAPLHLWNFFVRQTLLRSHNLLLRSAAPPAIVLVDYDLVHRRRWARRVYYAVRALLFSRDYVLIRRMQRRM
jgi:hypothetical protein